MSESESSMNVTKVEMTVKAAINRTAETKQNAYSEAHAAVQRAHPDVASKAGAITKEIHSDVSPSRFCWGLNFCLSLNRWQRTLNRSCKFSFLQCFCVWCACVGDR